MKKFLPLLLLVAATPAQARIHIAFHNGQTTLAAMATRPAGTLVKTGTDTWNNISNSGGVGLSPGNFVLLDRSGADSGARLAATAGFSTFNSNGWGGATQDHVMMEGWYGFRAAEAITVTNLPANYAAGFSVVLYGDSEVASRTMNYTIGGQTRTIQDAGLFSGSFSEGVNSTTFNGLTGTSFTLTGNPGASDPRSAVNGLVIIPNTIPQPPVIASFTANDHYIQPGGTATLSWQTTGATTLSIAPSPGTVSGPGGSVQVSPAATTTYTLTATSSNGSVTSTLRVGVGPPRPNILFFLVDDMGWQDTSEPFHYDSSGNPVVTPLNQRYHTPGMEALADLGMKFTRAYAHPVCTPTRVSWMTGRNPARHRVTFWTNPAGTETGGTTAVPHLRSPVDWLRTGIAATETPLPRLLAEAGYRTIHSGKAHFGSQGASGQYPTNLGFDVNIAGNEIGNPGSYSGNYGQSSSRPVPGLEAYHNTGTHLTEALTLELNKAIAKSVADGAPFFASMSHYAVHSPFEADPRFTANYPGLSGGALAYATLLEGMDKSLADIMAKLDQLGVAGNTLVIFLSDNGGDAPITDGNAPLRGKKAMRHEGGFREPMIVAWAKPDAANPFQSNIPIPAGSREDDLVHITDIFPTLLSVAGLNPGQGIDGHNLVPYLKAQPGIHRPQSLVTHFPHSHNNSFYSILHEGDWKLIFNYADESYELHNLAADIGESNNLAAAEPARVMAMARALARELRAMGALFPQNLNTASPQPLRTPNVPALDLDLDGITDLVEDPNRNGLADPGETDPSNRDSDGDGTSDGDEVRTGTNPLNPANSFQVDPLEVGGRFILRWPSKAGARYRIESTADLAGAWNVLAEEILATGNLTEFDAGPISGRSFFRVVLK